jgi:hypothetical protein
VQADSTKYIVGSFVGGSVLCVTVFYGSWLYTKHSLGVRDGTEYADKMRALTPDRKQELEKGKIGQAVQNFKGGALEWLESHDSLRRWKRAMRAGFGFRVWGLGSRVSGLGFRL